MYYSLEEVYYEQNQSYPEKISSKVLRSVDPALFTDPDGYTIGDPGSNYHYESSDCDLNGNCKHYKLFADMEKEAVVRKNFASLNCKTSYHHRRTKLADHF